MRYSNLTLVHLEDGIEIIYPTGKQKEVLFFYDDTGRFLQHTTWPSHIDANFEDILKNSQETIYIEEDCFLYYAFNLQVSYAHYLTQCLPKLNYYDKQKKIVVPKSTYNILSKTIFELLDIPNECILILQDNIKYVFKNIDTIPHIGSQWDGVGGEVNDAGVEVCKKLRNALGIVPSKNPTRKVYLKRNQHVSLEHNDSNIGKYRRISNEDQLIDLLVQNNFEIIELGSKTIQEKTEELKDIDVLITQLGANICNLIFSNTTNNILLLSNDRPVGEHYYFGLLDKLNLSQSKNLFIYPSSPYNVDPENSTNASFEVNLEDINKYLKNIVE
jgi:capsular polysaccharide biosynthesis protein